MQTKSIFQKLQRKKLGFIHPKVGDIIRIGIKIIEGEKSRIQYFQGLVIHKKNSFTNKTVTVRRIFQNIGVERNFPLNSPQIDSISILKSSTPKKAKLFYLRSRIGKAATRIR